MTDYEREHRPESVLTRCACGVVYRTHLQDSGAYLPKKCEQCEQEDAEGND